MGKEIEKKFLLTSDEWRQLGTGAGYCQGYLNSEKGRTVRVRTIADQAFLTIKGPTVGATRLEYEYDIPLDDATDMLKKLCHHPLIEKTRYKIPYAGLIWEIDEFKGENEGLLFAEVELEAEDQEFVKPPWIGKEVTDDFRYYNANLVKNPYSKWEK